MWLAGTFRYLCIKLSLYVYVERLSGNKFLIRFDADMCGKLSGASHILFLCLWVTNCKRVSLFERDIFVLETTVMS